MPPYYVPHFVSFELPIHVSEKEGQDIESHVTPHRPPHWAKSTCYQGMRTTQNLGIEIGIVYITVLHFILPGV